MEEHNVTDAKWVVIGRIITQTLGQPTPDVYAGVYGSLTTKEIAEVLSLDDEHATHTF